MCSSDLKRRKEIGKFKESVKVASLIDGLPSEFGIYIEEVKALAFHERPDYDALRNIFRKCFERYKFEADGVYDWTKPTQMARSRSEPLPTMLPPSAKLVHPIPIHHGPRYPTVLRTQSRSPMRLFAPTPSQSPSFLNQSTSMAVVDPNEIISVSSLSVDQNLKIQPAQIPAVASPNTNSETSLPHEDDTMMVSPAQTTSFVNAGPMSCLPNSDTQPLLSSYSCSSPTSFKDLNTSNSSSNELANPAIQIQVSPLPDSSLRKKRSRSQLPDDLDYLPPVKRQSPRFQHAFS